jgi:hypothetical protein
LRLDDDRDITEVLDKSRHARPVRARLADGAAHCARALNALGLAAEARGSPLSLLFKVDDFRRSNRLLVSKRVFAPVDPDA